MGVMINPEAWWTIPIPYQCEEAGIRPLVEAFNQHAGHRYFRAWQEGDKDYVIFKRVSHANSKVGKQGGAQAIEYDGVVGTDELIRTLYHEACHAIGLGHEHYHPKTTKRPVGFIDVAAFENAPKKYRFSEEFDVESIMLYKTHNPEGKYNNALSAGDKEMLERVARLR